jgi:hypothetical protein
MRDLPDGAALLRLARSLLLDELLPLLPENRRYDGRLIANAMVIAVREAATGARAADARRRELAALYAEAEPRAAGRPAAETADEAIERLSWRLAADLRSGQRDADPEVFATLRRVAADRLATVNPKALSAREAATTSDDGDGEGRRDQ